MEALFAQRTSTVLSTGRTFRLHVKASKQLSVPTLIRIGADIPLALRFRGDLIFAAYTFHDECH